MSHALDILIERQERIDFELKCIDKEIYKFNLEINELLQKKDLLIQQLDNIHSTIEVLIEQNKAEEQK